MLRSLYTSATGMLTQRKKMDVITNNISNIETAGYKKDKLVSRSFADMMLVRINDPAMGNITEIGSINTGVHVDEVITSFGEGAYEETGSTCDLALASQGFFAISTANGERYTRDGSFSVNTEGYLVTPSGDYVMGQNGQLQVKTDEFSVDSQGNITADGVAVGQLKIVTFGDPAGLRKTGDNLYINYTNQAAQTDGEINVMQGFIEASNVDIATEMVDMISVYRTYETNQKMIQMIDETLSKAVNEVGRV